MNRSVKGLLWLCAAFLLLALGLEAAGTYMSLCQVQQLQHELALLRTQVEQLNGSLDDVAALCASVGETQRQIQELFRGENPLKKLLPG